MNKDVNIAQFHHQHPICDTLSILQWIENSHNYSQYAYNEYTIFIKNHECALLLLLQLLDKETTKWIVSLMLLRIFC